jgi:hypothetical protein
MKLINIKFALISLPKKIVVTMPDMLTQFLMPEIDASQVI